MGGVIEVICSHTVSCKQLTEQHCHLGHQWCHHVPTGDQQFSGTMAYTLGNRWRGNSSWPKWKKSVFITTASVSADMFLYAMGTIPSIHCSGGCGIQQGELEWTCHLVLAPTHPKGQPCFLAGSSGLLPLAGCVPYRAVAADRPREDAAMTACCSCLSCLSPP